MATHRLHVEMKFKKFAVFIGFLPFFGLLFSIFWSILFDFDTTTATHCNVPNYLPSLSAAIGRTPQAYVWKTCIALHSIPRYLFTYIYFKILTMRQVKSKFKILQKPLAVICCLANLFELSGLLGLTVISSLENPDAHTLGFVFFMAGGLTCMISGCILDNITIFIKEEDLALSRTRIKAVLFNVASFVIAIYFYYRHNKYCEPVVYSMFAFFEYLVILSNMYFHLHLINYSSYDVAIFNNNNSNKLT